METNDIKLMWQKINSGNECFNDVNIEEIIKEKHSKIISRILNAQQLKMFTYSAILIIFIGLMIYALGICKLNLSIQAIIPLSLTGLFLFLKTIIEINSYRLLNSSTNDASIKESILFFRQRLNQVRMIEFISTLIYCYAWAIAIVLILLNDFNASIKNLLPFLIFLILIFLITPWLIKYFHPSYKNLFVSLEKVIEFLK